MLKEQVQKLFCQHCKALQKTNNTVVECWYNPLDDERKYAFCAANEDAVEHLVNLFKAEVAKLTVIGQDPVAKAQLQHTKKQLLEGMEE